MIACNNIAICENERLHHIISDPSSMLEMLNLNHTKLSTIGAIKLFTALSDGKKLRQLSVRGSFHVNDRLCDAIIMAMKKNTSLAELEMFFAIISGECAQLIVQAHHHNNTLQWISLTCLKSNEERIRSLVKEANLKRKSCECRMKLRVRMNTIG